MNIAGQMVEARRRAGRLYPSSAQARAYTSGAAAALAGSSKDACPYRSRRGWGPTFRTAWLRGFHSVASPDDA